MESLRAKIIDGSTIALDDVEATINVQQPTGSWDGWLACNSLTIGSQLFAKGGPFRLELDDGRSGEVIIRRFDPVAQRLTFRSRGPLE